MPAGNPRSRPTGRCAMTRAGGDAMRSRSVSVTLILACLAILGTACNMPAGGAGPRTWIDAPLDGKTLPLGPVVVRSHAASEEGTAQAALLVNGAQVRVDQAAD